MIVGTVGRQLQPLLDLGEGIRVHPAAEIDANVDLGHGTVVWSFSLVCSGVRTGPHCAIGCHAYVGRDTILGESVRIQCGAHLTDRMRVGNRVFIGPCVVTMNDRNPRVNNPAYKAEPPVIEDDVSVGAGAVILPGVTLGRGCVIGAGAVVTKDVAPGAVMVGNPAHPLRTRSPVEPRYDWDGAVTLLAEETV